jgi:dihydrofolate reductase
VYSRTLDAPSSERTRIERQFDRAAVRQLKESSPRDISIGGPELARVAIGAGLVDEYRVFLHPISVGAGKPALPGDQRVKLELLEERRFGSGVVYLRYALLA